MYDKSILIFLPSERFSYFHKNRGLASCEPPSCTTVFLREPSMDNPANSPLMLDSRWTLASLKRRKWTRHPGLCSQATLVHRSSLARSGERILHRMTLPLLLYHCRNRRVLLLGESERRQQHHNAWREPINIMSHLLEGDWPRGASVKLE